MAMRKYPALRPHLYAEEVNELIRRVVTNDESIDLHKESHRIFGCSGVTVDTTLDDLARMELSMRKTILGQQAGAPR
jgi:hypothetical protein